MDSTSMRINCSDEIFINRDVFTIKQVLEHYSTYNLKKSDLEELINTHIITPKVALNGDYAILITKSDFKFEFTEKVRSELLKVIPEYNKFVLTEANDFTPEQLKRVINSNASNTLVKCYGYWSIVSIIGEEQALLSPANCELDIQFLTYEFSNLELVFDSIEFKKIGQILKISSGLKNPKPNLPSYRIDPGPSDIIVSLLENNENISIQDLEGKPSALYLQFQQLFESKGRAVPEISERNFGRHIEKGLPIFKKNNNLK